MRKGNCTLENLMFTLSMPDIIMNCHFWWDDFCLLVFAQPNWLCLNDHVFLGCSQPPADLVA